MATIWLPSFPSPFDPFDDGATISLPTEPTDPNAGYIPSNPYFPPPPHISCNKCECCITVYPSLFFIYSPPITVCRKKRGGSCGSPPSSPPPLNPSPLLPKIPKGCGATAVLSWIPIFDSKPYWNYYDFSNAGWQGAGFSLGSQVSPENLPPPPDDDPESIFTADVCKIRLFLSASFFLGNGNFNLGDKTLDEKLRDLYGISPDWTIERFDMGCAKTPPYFRPNNPPPSPSPNPDPDKDDNDMACCDETNRLLREVLKRIGTPANKAIASNLTGSGSTKIPTLTDIAYEFPKLLAEKIGTGDYPAKMPVSLVDDKDSTVELSNLTQLIGYFIQQVDAVVGEFPIKIEIEDIDPTTQGNQTKQIEIPNIAEALAELYGTAIKGTINSEINLNFATRLAAEIVATKNSSAITQDYVKAISSWLGYRGNAKKRELNYAFSLGNPDTEKYLEGILKESKGSIVGWEEDDPESLVGYLQKLVFAAGIIKAVYFRGKKDTAQIFSETDRLAKADTRTQDEKWKTFLEEINKISSTFNQDSQSKPKITDLSFDPQI